MVRATVGASFTKRMREEVSEKIYPEMSSVCSSEIEEPGAELLLADISQECDDSSIDRMEEAKDQYFAVGDGLYRATVREPARFNILCLDAEGKDRPSSNEHLNIAIRGVAKVRHHFVKGERPGCLTVEWRPPNSGHYTIAISKGGTPLAGSPFKAQGCPRGEN